MTVQQIADALRGGNPVNAEFPWSAPMSVAPHMATALDPTWLKIAPLLRSMGVKRYAAIGALVGTLEACAVRDWNWNPTLIAFFDLDIPEYNPARDTGSFAYRNVCSAQGANYQGEFVYARCNSLTTHLIDHIGPFDCILVDGQHSKDAVRTDMSTALRCLVNGGTILVHDLELPDTGLGDAYHQWLLSHPELPHAEVDKRSIVHGLGIVQKF